VAENHRFRCSNPSCQKIFDEPVKAKNLGPENTEAYDACPYCLTAITAENPSADEKSGELETVTVETESVGIRPREEAFPLSSPKGQACTHHLGYLSERSAREKIPEECIVCENVLQCMLKAAAAKHG
jgi:hypothetical protein